MSNSNESDTFLKELDLLPSQSAEVDDESILDKMMSVENPDAEDSRDSSELEKQSDSPAPSDSSKTAADPTTVQCIGENASEDNTDSSTNPTSKDNEDLTSTNKTSGSTEKSNNVIDDVDAAVAALCGSVSLEKSKTSVSSKTKDAPEIVPNSETRASSITVDSEEDPSASPMETDEVREVSHDSSEELTVQSATIQVKEEMLEDDSPDDPEEVGKSSSSFLVSPSFEENLNPKFKPTIMLEKINVSSSVKTEGDDTESISDSNAHSSEETASDEEDHAGNPRRRPRRSIKTPRRFLTNGYSLLSKKPGPKSSKTAGSMVGSKSIPKHKPSILSPDRSKLISKPSSVSSGSSVSTDIAKTIESNFVPIKPKPPMTEVKVNISNDVSKNRSIVILPSKPVAKPSQDLQSKSKPVAKPSQDSQSKAGVKPGQEAKTPTVNKQSPSSDFAKSIVRTLNADSVPGILKKSKRKADGEDSASSVEFTSTDVSGTPTSAKGNQNKKQKIEPKKPPPRRQRKIFDYESYLREHQETEVNDKKPNSGDIAGEPFKLLSSLVGVNIPPSKIKVLPFTNSSNNALKSSLVQTRNAAEVSNFRNKERKERTLYDMMQDISHLLPSWNLHVMLDSSTFCIAQVCRGRSGIPTLKTSIELDSQFNAKVFIHQLHCKRYDGVYDSEESISALIQEIDSLSK